MTGKEFDLETLHHILEQFSKDVAGDCSKLIENLLKSESSSNKSFQLINEKVFASIKVLLGLYEKLTSTKTEPDIELPVNVIVQTIGEVLHCNNKKCNLPDSEVQCNIISILSSLFKNVVLLKSSKNHEHLAQLYIHTLTCLNSPGECKCDCLIFKLKIVNSIYHALTHVADPHNDEFIEKIKSINKLDECELFANLILYHSDDIAIQTLMYLMPEYIKCFKSQRVVEVIWKQFSNTVENSNNENFRVLIVLCNIFDICSFKSIVKYKIDLTKLLLEDASFWKLVQSALVESDPVKKKQGMFLLKKTVDLLISTNRNFVCNLGNTFYWHSDCKDELYRIYSEIIISLEFLEEQQVHIIKPALNMVLTLGKEIIECDKVSYTWILVLYKKALMHESTQIVKWGFSNLLKLPVKFFLHEHITKEVVVLLVDALNNMSLYYSNGLLISRELNDFFSTIMGLSSAKLFFNLFIKRICSQVWSAEALFFVIHSFSGIQQFSSWGEEEIAEIGMFVMRAFKTHNKIIRSGVQCELLNAITCLTDYKHVPLECVILLISKFCLEEVTDSQAWLGFTAWLRNSYSKKDADDVLEKYKKTELGTNFNEKFLSLMLTLFDSVFYSDTDVSPALNHVHNMLLSFREIEKRLYCDKLLHDKYLSVVCSVYELNVNDLTTQLVKPTLPFARDILLYIQTQLQQISNLQDFDTCESYLNSFQIILKTLVLFEIQAQGNSNLKDTPESLLSSLKINSKTISSICVSSEVVHDLCNSIVRDCEACLHSNSGVSPIGEYWRIKLLSIVLEVCPLELKSSLLGCYLLNEVNEPLKKDAEDSKTTRDLQTLWGKMNSQFIEGKWKILKYLITSKLVSHEASSAEWMGNDGSVKLCLEALNSGGYGVLCPVLSLLQDVLPPLEMTSEVRRIVDSVWKLIMERRKTEEFKVFIKHFVELLYQQKFILKGKCAQEILSEYADLIFSDSSLAVVNIFMKHIQQIDILNYSIPLFCHIIGKGLMFGPVQRKDERLTNQVCQHVEALDILPARKIGDYNISNEVRARAVQMIVTLDPCSTHHRTAAKSLIDILLQMEKDLNKNKIRYFGNSHVHRVKHRLMQSLLLLEPMLGPNEDRAKELSSWLYHCLMTENSQPSVRYQQEWLLVRMLLRHPDLYRRYCISNYNKNFEESSKRSLCSAIAVAYHLCKMSPGILLEERILTTMDEIFSFCFHQHFEVRLYSQVVFHKLYSFSESHKLAKVIEKFQFINTNLAKIFGTHLKGNFGKNLEKMLEDFYFTEFNVLKHYSLEMIYMDLPRLTNIDSDEWISAEMFQACGVCSDGITVPLKSAHSFTLYASENKWAVEKSNPSEVSDQDDSSEVTFGNYQKKIIPQKPLIPGWDESSTSQNITTREGGLIVVASLIDRIPNLGGLARTCEIFGASEYVVSSLKYTEDKQFTSLSVTAEKWISIKEVKTQNLLDYIFEMKQKGYTVIGAEQMLHSVPLGSAKFPKKSLLLLGNEKEGIPPNLLPLLDICIEIPQFGIIRSLNVHVTGALFIWEYAKQNHIS